MLPDIRIPYPINLPGYTWRPINADDARELNRMLLDVEAADRSGNVDTLEDRERDFQDPDTNLAMDTVAALTSAGHIAAMGWVFTPPPTETEYFVFTWGEFHPAHRNIELKNAIMDWMEARGRQILAGKPHDLPHNLRVFTLDSLTDRVDLFLAHGYQPVRSFYRMQCDLGTSISPPAQPQGITITPWRPELEMQVFDAFNASFRDHWGFFPMSAENWKLHMMGNSDFRPDLSYIAFVKGAAGGETVVGFSINQVHKAYNESRNIREGWIQDLGVLRDWRKRGIATALLQVSMVAFKENGFDYAGLGVDTDNPTGALRIYERLGFKPILRHITLAKPIS